MSYRKAPASPGTMPDELRHVDRYQGMDTDTGSNAPRRSTTRPYQPKQTLFVVGRELLIDKDTREEMQLALARVILDNALHPNWKSLSAALAKLLIVPTVPRTTSRSMITTLHQKPNQAQLLHDNCHKGAPSAAESITVASAGPLHQKPTPVVRTTSILVTAADERLDAETNAGLGAKRPMSENPGYIHGVRLAELEMNDVSGTHRGLTVLNTLVEPLEAFYPEGAEMRLGPVDIFTVEAPVQVLPLA